jgi:hypothetical protein
MADVIKFGRTAHAGGEGIPPALRSFIDEVIVPARVRAYLAERKMLNVFASDNGAVATSAKSDAKSCEASR